MKIVLICTGYDYEFPHPACGGSEACTEKLAIGLHRNNIDTTVICPKRETKGDYNFSIIETDAIPYRYDRNSDFQSQAIDIAINLKPDLLITQNPHPKLKELNCLVLINNHGGGDGRMGGDLFIDSKNIYHRFISQTQLQRCIKNLPELKNKYLLAETSLIDEDFNFSPVGEYFLWCASLFWGFETKGLDLFISLASCYPKHNFIAYGMGDGKIEKYLKNEVEPKIQNFKFNGFLDRYKDHNEVFSKAIAYCQFSRLEESFGRTTIEALSKGVPVIHLGGGATPELVGSHGVLINDEKDLINSVQQISRIDREETYKYAKQKFHVNQEIDKILDFYKEHKI